MWDIFKELVLCACIFVGVLNSFLLSCFASSKSPALLARMPFLLNPAILSTVFTVCDRAPLIRLLAADLVGDGDEGCDWQRAEDATFDGVSRRISKRGEWFLDKTPVDGNNRGGSLKLRIFTHELPSLSGVLLLDGLKE
jgi:hypothetical protein